MKIVALVGESGTGKSHKAMNLASSKGIRYIIDDGLLIHDAKRIAGKSAKRETTRLSAVRRAIFQFDDHCKEVKEAIERVKPDQLLIIGTSNKMVQNIARNLQIGEIDEYVYIDAISTKEEIKLARETRLKHGKHVIPLPTVEIKRDFSGYFLDSVKTIIRRREHEQETEIGEKTIVRPTFSYMGRFTISNRVIIQIVEHTCHLHEAIATVQRVRLHKHEEQIKLDLELSMHYGTFIAKSAEEIQISVKEALEHMTRLHVISVNIHVKSLNFLN
ncbi:MAG: Asp23/Gls24 family envelope stress response protein [Pedobacter sp.]|jgi:uncharacterized alkaline shock family protein YloU|uniref:Asp23/Gls24 family envelope stress response protein n=1 Tax=Pedobacter sp. TaxID=1411316 RepID=UPI003566DDE9